MINFMMERLEKQYSIKFFVIIPVKKEPAPCTYLGIKKLCLGSNPIEIATFNIKDTDVAPHPGERNTEVTITSTEFKN